MSTEDDSARKQRARQLRTQIDQLLEQGKNKTLEKTGIPDEAPREFIHRRMWEWDQKKEEP